METLLWETVVYMIPLVILWVYLAMWLCVWITHMHQCVEMPLSVNQWFILLVIPLICHVRTLNDAVFMIIIMYGMLLFLSHFSLHYSSPLLPLMIFPFLLTDGHVGTHPGITLPPFNVSNDSVYVTNLTCPDHLTHCLAHSVTSKACSSGYLTVTCQRGTV